ncbi:uncharacterized protein [Bombus fervidus]|uniref:uncharacterized protein n=1 Tax=Bombus fervidus TaxID=203811 RepID=UPI003AB354E5
MRYLDLTIDSGWTFGPHFNLLVPKVTAAANVLYGLLPNIGEARTGVRRLYEGVIRSRVLYEAPIWAGDLMANRRSLTLLRRLHRTTAIRIARGYRTISHASASVLAASPPFELQALAFQQVYDHLRDLGTSDGGTQPTNCDRPVQEVRREVRLEKDVLESIECAKAKFGGVNVLINSAGVVGYENIYDFKNKKPRSTDLEEQTKFTSTNQSL